MHKLLLLFIFAASSSRAVANETSVIKRFGVNCGIQYYINNMNVDRAKVGPQAMSVKNTFGYGIGIEHERIRKNGVVLAYGIDFCWKMHEINTHFDLSNFDPQAVNNLQGKSVSDKFVAKQYYLCPRILLGYRGFIGNGWYGLAKAGVAMKYVVHYSENFSIHPLSYTTDNTNEVRNASPMEYSTDFGKQYAFPKRGFEYNYDLLMLNSILYIGVEKALQHNLIKNFSIGLECSGLIFWEKSHSAYPPEMIITSHAGYNSPAVSFEKYTDRNVYVGLKVGVGLWN